MCNIIYQKSMEMHWMQQLKRSVVIEQTSDYRLEVVFCDPDFGLTTMPQYNELGKQVIG